MVGNRFETEKRPVAPFFQTETDEPLVPDGLQLLYEETEIVDDGRVGFFS
jgi:hypothetical protein